MRSFAVVAFAFSLFAVANGVALDAVCTATSDCTPTNSECSLMFKNCAKGNCKCKTGYMAVSGECKLEVTNAESCDATKYCMGGTTCTSSTCQCTSGNTYHSNLQMCITTGQKAIGEVCTQHSDCYEGTTESECVANSGTSTPLYCRCKAGYTTDGYTCRAPTLDETCVSIACATMLDATSFLTSAGQETETCQSGTCACPSTADKITVTSGSTTYKICQTKYTGTEKANGAACTASNTCTSNLCAQCPGETSSTCVTTVTANAAEPTAAKSVTSLLVVVAAGLVLV